MTLIIAKEITKGQFLLKRTLGSINKNNKQNRSKEISKKLRLQDSISMRCYPRMLKSRRIGTNQRSLRNNSKVIFWVGAQSNKILRNHLGGETRIMNCIDQT